MSLGFLRGITPAIRDGYYTVFVLGGLVAARIVGRNNVSESPSKSVLLLTKDLIFETKIRSTAQAVGVALSAVRSTASLAAELDRVRPGLVIVDLNADGGIEAVATAKGHPGSPRVLAYVSHVDVDLAERARVAGADEVMPRSRFVSELPRVLGG